MDTPRSALRDRSNDDDFATASLARSLGDHEEPSKRSSLAGTTSSSSDPEAAVGAGDPAAAAAAAAASAVPIVTPEPPPQPGVNTDPSAPSAGASQLRDGEDVRTGDTRARRESPAAAHSNRRHHGSTRHNNPAATRPRRPPPPPPPPPPVACTLVAFEPGSLGLELEAIVDEEAKMAQRGDKHRDQRRGRSTRRPPRRLGCRVFRVTPDGQAARHGSVHPGDAMVVLDG